MVPYVKLAILCNYAAGINMTCDVPTLLEAAKCFECQIPLGMVGYIELYLLCQLASGQAGGGGGGGVTCGTSDPVAAPTGTCALYYRTDNGSLWMWNGSAWNVLIAA